MILDDIHRKSGIDYHMRGLNAIAVLAIVIFSLWGLSSTLMVEYEDMGVCEVFEIDGISYIKDFDGTQVNMNSLLKQNIKTGTKILDRRTKKLSCGLPYAPVHHDYQIIDD